jgi:hypothetical protein
MMGQKSLDPSPAGAQALGQHCLDGGDNQLLSLGLSLRSNGLFVRFPKITETTALSWEMLPHFPLIHTERTRDGSVARGRLYFGRGR